MARLFSPTPDLLNHYSNTHNLNQDKDLLFTNQILDIVFTSNLNEKLGFGVRIDEIKKCLQINSIDQDGEAYRVGLKKGDIVLAVNDIDIGKHPEIGLQALKHSRSSIDDEQEIRITVCRRIFDHIMIKVQRCGVAKCNGKYYFNHLDEEYDSPIFINTENNLLLLKANYDMETGESLWTLSDETNNYYIGVSTDLMPPNDSWEPIKKVGLYPSPGLVFYNTTQRLVSIYGTPTTSGDDTDADEFIEINYDAAACATANRRNGGKRMSRIGLNALNDPSSINHPSIVYEHLNQLKEEEYESFTSDAYDEENEWKVKYDELLERYNDSEQIIQELRVTVDDLNCAVYDYWLKDKKKEHENDTLQDTIYKQNEEIVEQNKAEVKLVNEIKDKTSHIHKISSLYDIDLDELCIDNLSIDLNLVQDENVMHINQLNAEITELQEENMKMKLMYEEVIDENKVIMKFNHEIERLQRENIRVNASNNRIKKNSISLQEENMQRNANNQRLKQLVGELKKENRLIIESKLGLVQSTATEIVKLKNTINGMLRMSDMNSTAVRKLYLSS